jgi:hypothetical protein
LYRAGADAGHPYMRVGCGHADYHDADVYDALFLR